MQNISRAPSVKDDTVEIITPGVLMPGVNYTIFMQFKLQSSYLHA